MPGDLPRQSQVGVKGGLATVLHAYQKEVLTYGVACTLIWVRGFFVDTSWYGGYFLVVGR